MDSEQSSGKSGKVKKNSFFSLRRSFSSRGNSEEAENAEDFAAGGSPGSSPANRRSSAPAMGTVDENNSDAGTESGTKKKSRRFSTKFVTRMFRSNSSSAHGNEAPFSPEGGDSLAGGADEQYDERMSEVSASVADGDGTTPKKKKSKIFSTKFVKKMFRSNSLTSNGAPDTPGSAGPEGPLDLNDPNQNDGTGDGSNYSMPRRKSSFFSFGKGSTSGDAKSTALSGIASPEPDRKMPVSSPDGAYQGPVSPSFVPPSQQKQKATQGDTAAGDSDDEKEEQVVQVDTSFKAKQSFFESRSSSVKSPQSGIKTPQTAAKTAQSQQKQQSVASPASPGTAKMLFQTVDEDETTSPAPSGATAAEEKSETKAQESTLDAAPNTPLATTPLDAKRGSVLTPKSQPKSPVRAAKSPLNSTTITSPVRTPAAATTPKAHLASTSPIPAAKTPLATPAAKTPLATPAAVKTPTVARTNTPKSPVPAAAEPTPAAAPASGPASGPVPMTASPSPPKPAVEVVSVRKEPSASFDAGSDTPPPPPPATPGSTLGSTAGSVAGSTVGEGSAKTRRLSMFSAAKSITKMFRRASFSATAGSTAGEDSAADAQTEAEPAVEEPVEDVAEDQGEWRSPAASSRVETRSMSPGRYAYGTAASAAYPIPASPPAQHVSHHDADEELGGQQVPYEAETGTIDFTVEYGTGPGEEDPSVLRIHAPGRPEIELADKLVSKSPMQPVLTLILRNNAIYSPERFCFAQRFERLTDLDLAFNCITGTVKGLPSTLRKLDLSHNKITNIASILTCLDLTDLNLAHNNIKTFYGLPPKLERLDLSHNVISAIMTLRTLALSPGIKHLDLSGNSVVLEVKEWKAIIRNTLTQLTELNGRALPKIKKLGALPPAVNGNRASPPRARTSAACREEQRVNDAVRTKMHQLKLDLIEESKTTLERNQVVKGKTLRPEEVNDLSKRLAAPTKAFKQRTSTAPAPPALFSSKDLLRRKSNTLSLSTAPVGRGADVDLTAWLNRSKLQLEKAAKAVTKAMKLANQELIENDDVTALSSLLSRQELVAARDPPLKIESAIAKLAEGDAMKRRASTMRDQMEVLGLLLLQVDSAVLLSAQGAFPLRDALDSALASGPGLLAHTTLLRACDASFDPHLLARKDGNSKTWQNKPAPSQHLDSSASNVDDGRDEGSHQYSRSNGGSRGGSPGRQNFTESRRDSGDRYGFAETKSLEAPARVRDPSLTPEAFMDRVRSRITMRALYGAESIIPAATAPGPDRSPERRSLDFSTGDNLRVSATAPAAPAPMPLPLALPLEVASVDKAPTAAALVPESKVSEPDQDAKRAAKERVLARMNRAPSRSSMESVAESTIVKPPISAKEDAAPGAVFMTTTTNERVGVPEALLAPPAVDARASTAYKVPPSAAVEVAAANNYAHEEVAQSKRSNEQSSSILSEQQYPHQEQQQAQEEATEVAEEEDAREDAPQDEQEDVDGYGYDTGYDAGYDTAYAGGYDAGYNAQPVPEEEYIGGYDAGYDAQPAHQEEPEGEYSGGYGEEQQDYYGDAYDAAPQDQWGEDSAARAADESDAYAGEEDRAEPEQSQYYNGGSGYYDPASPYVAYDNNNSSTEQDSYAYYSTLVGDDSYAEAATTEPNTDNSVPVGDASYGEYDRQPAKSVYSMPEPAPESAPDEPVREGVGSSSGIAAASGSDTVVVRLEAAPVVVQEPVSESIPAESLVSAEVKEASAPADPSPVVPAGDGEAKLTAKERLLARMAKNKKA